MRKLYAIAAALLMIGFGGALMAQQIGSVSNGFIEEGNLVRPGNVTKTITMSNRGQDETTCRRACEADGNCNAYTYVQEASNRKPLCYLRMLALPSGATRSHGYSKAVSGTKLSYLPDVYQITPHPGRAMSGGTVSRQMVSANRDPVACSDACKRDGNCTGFTYYPLGSVPNKPNAAYCWIYSENGQLTRNTQPGFLSGTKIGSQSGPVVKRPLSRPSPKPTLRAGPTVRPRIKTDTPVLPDQTQVEKQEDATASDDVDNPEAFPGEMLEPPE